MLFSDGVFDAETLAMMHRVLDAAWCEFEESGRVVTDPLAVRMLMAKRIMAEVQRGEVDPERLKVLALNTADGRGIDG